jgi:hypothetical protein
MQKSLKKSKKEIAHRDTLQIQAFSNNLYTILMLHRKKMRWKPLINLDCYYLYWPAKYGICVGSASNLARIG